MSAIRWIVAIALEIVRWAIANEILRDVVLESRSDRAVHDRLVRRIRAYGRMPHHDRHRTGRRPRAGQEED